MGHPLSQTIFTSLYIDRLLSPCPSSLNQTYFDRINRNEYYSLDEPLHLQILRAYCLGLIKTCYYINSRVKAEHYYEVISLGYRLCGYKCLWYVLGRGFRHTYVQQKPTWKSWTQHDSRFYWEDYAMSAWIFRSPIGSQKRVVFPIVVPGSVFEHSSDGWFEDISGA